MNKIIFIILLLTLKSFGMNNVTSYNDERCEEEIKKLMSPIRLVYQQFDQKFNECFNFIKEFETINIENNPVAKQERGTILNTNVRQSIAQLKTLVPDNSETLHIILKKKIIELFIELSILRSQLESDLPIDAKKYIDRRCMNELTLLESCHKSRLEEIKNKIESIVSSLT